MKENLDSSNTALEEGRRCVRERTKKELEKRLKERREARLRQLVSEGVSEKDAKKTVHEEYNEIDKNDLKKSEEELKKKEEEEDSALDNLINERSLIFEDSYEKDLVLMSKKIVGENDEAIVQLNIRVEKEEEKEVVELISQGIDKENAILTAKLKSEKDLKEGLEEIEKKTTQKSNEIKEKLKNKLDSDLENLKNLETHAREILEEGLLKHKIDEKEQLLKIVEEKRIERVKELISLGKTENEAIEISNIEAEKMKIKNEAKIESNIDRSTSLIKESAKRTYEQMVLAIKLEHEKKRKGLESYFLMKKKESEKRLQDRLNKRKTHRERGLLASGFLPSEVADIVAEELGSDSSILTEGMDEIYDNIEKEKELLFQIATDGLNSENNLINKNKINNEKLDDQESSNLLEELLNKEKILLKNNDDVSNALLEASRNASRNTQEIAEKKISDLRDLYEKNVKKLELELLSKKENNENNLRLRLAEKKKKRILDLENSGLSKEKSEQQAEEEIKIEFENNLLELHKMSVDEYEQKVGIEKKNLLENERIAINKEHDEAILMSENAIILKNAAMKKLENIRKEQEDKLNSLEEEMKASRNAQEEVLKKRLKEKREKKLKILSAQNASEREKEEEQNEISRNEHLSMLKMKKEMEENEKIKREEFLRRSEEEIEEAKNTVERAEIESRSARAKEEALHLVKESKIRAENDQNTREILRMREEHSRLEEKTNRELENSQIKGKGKLQDRLAAKKLRKEMELKIKETKELSELKEKQKNDEEERIKLKDLKLNWIDKLKIAMDESDKNGLIMAEKEEYCIQETIVKDIVPVTHLNEAVSRIFNQRNKEEMSILLNTHFDERVNSIKCVVENVLEEKSQARTELLVRITTEEISDENAKILTLELEEVFNKKQLQEEKKVTGLLNSRHTKEQIDLKQKQLENISQIVSLYATSESLARLQKEGGKSQIEELSEYRKRLETEKKVREENLLNERNLTEKKLREEMANEMLEMRNQLIDIQKVAEKEFDDKKLELLKQREELELKQINEKGLMNQQEKDRILIEFEKEKNISLEALENTKKNQKQKLNDRLAAKRKSKAIFEGINTPDGNDKFNGNEKINGNDKFNVSGNVSLRSKETLKLTRKNSKKSLLSENERERENANLLSMKMIEDKLEHIERMIVAIEVKAAVVDSLSLSSPRGQNNNNNNNFNATNNFNNSNNFGNTNNFNNNNGNNSNFNNTSNFGGTQNFQSNNNSGDNFDKNQNIYTYKDNNEPQSGIQIQVLPDIEVSVQDNVRLEYGCRLAVMIGLPDLKINIATELPCSNILNNSFSNSYYYDEIENRLLIHFDRMKSSGDFGLVVVHALSHIKVSEGEKEGEFIFSSYFSCLQLPVDLIN